MADIRKIAETLVSLTILEVKELARIMEEEHGIKAPEPTVQIIPEQAPEAKEEQTEFDVMITAIGGQKLSVIKEVRNLAGIGLRESKELVEGMDKPVQTGISKDQAEDIKAKLESVGATIELR